MIFCYSKPNALRHLLYWNTLLISCHLPWIIPFVKVVPTFYSSASFPPSHASTSMFLTQEALSLELSQSLPSIPHPCLLLFLFSLLTTRITLQWLSTQKRDGYLGFSLSSKYIKVHQSIQQKQQNQLILLLKCVSNLLSFSILPTMPYFGFSSFLTWSVSTAHN